MYTSHFRLRRLPFPTVPDGSCYYAASGHERAVARLQQALACQQGPLLLTGEPGVGKTLLIHVLLERLGNDFAATLLTGGRFREPAALLQAFLFDLGQPYENRTEQELRLAVTDQLLQRYKDGTRTLLIVDEAHLLSGEVLEELRLLGNLEAAGGKAVQVLLVGLPKLLETLARPELTPLRQRLAVRAVIEPLGAEEASDYLLHHVRAAGGNPEEFFADDALELLVRGTRGIPRLLNQAAHQALQLAAESQAEAVDVEASHGALEMLGLADELDDAQESSNDSHDPLLALAARPA